MVGIGVLGERNGEPVEEQKRDSVESLPAQSPTIVSISDIHGFLQSARSALLTLTDHSEYEPIVESGRLGELQWAGGEEYVLVFNGDLIDRGAHSAEVLELVERLVDQAPPGHVRVTFGNHEMGILTPDFFNWGNWYSTTRTDDQRLSFLQHIRHGHTVAAYEGYNVTYAHAGLPEPYEVSEVNEELVAGARDLEAVIGDSEDAEMQEQLVLEYPRVFGVDGERGRGPEAGIAWLDFEYMPGDAPPQVVGHTRQDSPLRRGNVICQNVIRNNRRKDGGEAVLVETPDRLVALGRNADDTVREHEFDLPASV